MQIQENIFNPKDYEVFSSNLKIAIVVSKFNSFITERLLNGATGFLRSINCDIKEDEIFQVPGAFEIPVVCENICQEGSFDGIVTIGCVIRGETSHYDYVCKESASGIMKVSLKYPHIPVSFGVLTCENKEQALDRAGGKHGNKGEDAAKAMLDLILLYRKKGISKKDI